MCAASAPPLPEFAIETEGLTKTYRSRDNDAPVQALVDFDIQIPRGAFFGLLGPNGAGKSTFINILAGLTTKSSGRAAVWGFDIDRASRGARSAIGVVPQELNLDAFFTPRAALDLQAGFYAVPKAERRTDELLAFTGLTEKADAYARSLSGGMRRRLLIAKAMVHTPPILVLDEPTAGVDIELRWQLWEHIRALNARGTTIVLTTHYLEEAEQLCDAIAIINHGRLVACAPTQDLVRRLDWKELLITVDSDLDAVPPALDAYRPELILPRRLRIRYRPSETPVEEIITAVHGADLTIIDLSTEESDLEDIFVEIVNAEAHDGRGARR